MLKLFKNFEKKQWAMVAACLVFIVGQVWLDLLLPDYMSQITLLVQTQGSQISQILSAGGYMLLCALGSALLSVVTGFFAAKVAADFSFITRRKVFGKVQEFGPGEMNQFSTASLITRTTNDITQIQMVVAMGLQVLIKAPILAVWAVLKILGKSWEWSVVTAIAVLVLLITMVVLAVLCLPKFKVLQKQTDDLNRVTRENLTGLRVVRAFNAQEYQEKKFEGTNSSLTKTNLFTERAMAILNPAMNLIMGALPLAVYWVGAYIIEGAQLGDKLTVFSDMVVFSSYAMQVVMAFTMITIIFMILPRASVSAARINQVLDTQPAVREGTKADTARGAGQVEFKGVSFKYPDSEEYVLKDISFTARPGETVAFIGSTGSGKSTLVNLISRFYDASEGTVYVDGTDVREYKFETLYNKLGYVAQKAVLFSGTVDNNITFGKSAMPTSPDDVVTAIDIAQASEFVQSKPGCLNYQIAQGGANLSGGQKQRLSIARAIARKPEILIFDDSFSALDYATDQKLRKRIAQDLRGVTCLIVAQRIGTIKNADKIIVLDQGKLAGMGTHQELMASCQVYREIAYSQLNKEELEA